MTEAKWLSCTDPATMLRWLQTVDVPERKSLLFLVAVSRLQEDRYRAIVDGLEAYADRSISYDQLDAIYRSENAYDGVPFVTFQVKTAVYSVPTTKTAQKQASRFIKHIFGNPFRPVAFDPAWRTSTVLTLAEAIYADRAFDRLPILADALEDAGCEAAELLAHLRGGGPHVRGCWALDLVLGKE